MSGREGAGRDGAGRDGAGRDGAGKDGAEKDEAAQEEGAAKGGAGEEAGREARGGADDREMEAPRREERQDAIGELLGRLLARGREEARNALRRGKDEIHLRQLRLDRDRMYQKLGKETRALLEAGEVDHPGLARGVERIREVEAKLREAEDAARGLALEKREAGG